MLKKLCSQHSQSIVNCSAVESLLAAILLLMDYLELFILARVHFHKSEALKLWFSMGDSTFCRRCCCIFNINFQFNLFCSHCEQYRQWKQRLQAFCRLNVVGGMLFSSYYLQLLEQPAQSMRRNEFSAIIERERFGWTCESSKLISKVSALTKAKIKSSPDLTSF